MAEQRPLKPKVLGSSPRRRIGVNASELRPPGARRVLFSSELLHLKNDPGSEGGVSLVPLGTAITG